MAKEAGRPATDELATGDIAAIGAAPAVQERGVPVVNSAFGQRRDEQSARERPGHAFAGEWLDIASRVAHDEVPVAAKRWGSPGQVRRAFPRQACETWIRGEASFLKDRFRQLADAAG